jgi:hypothetical protein
MRLFLRIAVWVFAFAPFAGSLAAQPLLRSVLVIDEADPVRPAYFPLNSAFRSMLNKGLTTRVAVYAENLDLSRFEVHSSTQLWAPICEKSTAKDRLT